MIALFIGRFQPFHKGHLYCLQSICQHYDSVIIGVGSSQYSNSEENPFSFIERKTMIEQVIKTEHLNDVSIVAIPDIHNPPKWVDHVVSLVPSFDVVFSNNTLTKQLFSTKGYAVKETVLYERKIYSGVEIRRRMRANEPWEDLVPECVVTFIDNIDGVCRVKKGHT